MIIFEGQIIPIGYAVVRKSPVHLGYEVLPIPLHWLKRLYYWIRWYDRTKLDKHIEAKQKEYFEQGRKNKDVEWRKRLTEDTAKVLQEFTKELLK